LTVAGAKRHLGGRSRVLIVLVAGIALVWMLRLATAWADRTAYAITLLGFVVGVVLLADWLIASYGPGLWRFTRSVTTSLWDAIRVNEEVLDLVGRHPRVFGWLGRRLSAEKPSGLYLTITAVMSLYFFWSFVSISSSLVLSRAITQYDTQILALFRAFRTPGLTRLFWAATVVADPRVIPLLALAAVLLLAAWGRRSEAALLVTTLFVGLLVQTPAKMSFGRARPPAVFALIKEPASFSFPSGHAFTSMLFFGILVFILWRALPGVRERLAVLLVAGVIVATVGLSRLYLGVHWPSDVLASWSLALALISAMCGGYLMLVRYRALPEQWPTWSSSRVRWAATWLIVLFSFVATVVGSQADPLLGVVAAGPPTREWPVTLRADGTPSPSARELKALPLFSEKLDGTHQEPIGIVFVGSEKQLIDAFEAAGWQVADKPSLTTLGRAAGAAISNRTYPTAPVTPTFLDGAVQDVAFEKPEGSATVRRRHHARFWKTRLTVRGVPVWVATASYDSGLEIGSTIPLPTHRIDPNIDVEQAYLVGDLVKTGQVALVGRVTVTQPSTGSNAQGDAWFTQGYASLLRAVH
jgi:membrane-associated phospholipid phosphatase